MPGSKGSGRGGFLSQGRSKISAPLSFGRGCVWTCLPPLGNPRISLFPAEGRGGGVVPRVPKTARPPKPTSAPAQVRSGTRLARKVRARANGCGHAGLQQRSASRPGSRSRSGWAPSGPHRACPAPERGPGAAGVLGAARVRRDRLRALGIREEWGALKESSPKAVCACGPAIPAPAPCERNHLSPSLAGCGARRLEKPGLQGRWATKTSAGALGSDQSPAPPSLT